MKKHKIFALISAFLLLLSACSSIDIETKKVDYKSVASAKGSTLEVPPDLTNPAQDGRFLVPDSGGKGGASFSVYAGERNNKNAELQSTAVLPAVDKARIERDGSSRWLVVNESPDKLWGTVKDFWQELGFTMNIDAPNTGVMETDWAENRANLPNGAIRNLLGRLLDTLYSTAERDKFRTRLEAGKTPGTTEIYVSHRGLYEIYINEAKDQTRWQPRNPEPELEAEMLRRLMLYFGTDQQRAAVEVAKAPTAPDRARLSKSGDGSIEVLESFDRAWRRIGLALDRVGFTVEDRDRTKGIYFVRYVDPEIDNSKKDAGFLDKLAFWKSNPEIQTQYRVEVRSTGDLTTVFVAPAEGKTDSPETRQKILSLLHNQLK